MHNKMPFVKNVFENFVWMRLLSVNRIWIWTYYILKCRMRDPKWTSFVNLVLHPWILYFIPGPLLFCKERLSKFRLFEIFICKTIWIWTYYIFWKPDVCSKMDQLRKPCTTSVTFVLLTWAFTVHDRCPTGLWACTCPAGLPHARGPKLTHR